MKLTSRIRHRWLTCISRRYRTHTRDANATLRNAVTLHGGQLLFNVHAATLCQGRPCPIHHPSNHHMVTWPLNWRGNRDMMERTCPHGIGHPDPDHMAHTLTRPGHVDEYDSGVHGCDGCCDPGNLESSDRLDATRYMLTGLHHATEQPTGRHSLRDVAAEFGVDLEKD